MRALSTLEWIVVAIIALVMISYVLGFWGGIWGQTATAAEKANSTFVDALKRAFG